MCRANGMHIWHTVRVGWCLGRILKMFRTWKWVLSVCAKVRIKLVRLFRA